MENFNLYLMEVKNHASMHLNTFVAEVEWNGKAQHSESKKMQYYCNSPTRNQSIIFSLSIFVWNDRKVTDILVQTLSTYRKRTNIFQTKSIFAEIGNCGKSMLFDLIGDKTMENITADEINEFAWNYYWQNRSSDL